MYALKYICRDFLRNYVHSDLFFSNRLDTRVITRCISGPGNFCVNDTDIKKYVESLVKEYKNLIEYSSKELSESERKLRIAELRPVYDVYSTKLKIIENLTSLQELHSDDSEMCKLVKEEEHSYMQMIEKVDHQLLEALLTEDTQNYKTIMIEIAAGVGGQEAMLFAKELYEMYISYVTHKGWMLEISDCEDSDMGGLRHAVIFVSGNEAYKHMRHEAGVHRVQRVPATEKAGRVHTSTVSVRVLPQPEEVDIVLNNKDLHIETKRATGAGGQHVNKTDSAVRITHLPTGIAVECQVDRSQIQNRKIAMQKLRALLYQKELDEQREKTNSARKQQVKSNLRSEKIRTYNFNQDRITDHRIGKNVHNLIGFFTGRESLDSLINDLEDNFRKEVLLQKMAERNN